MSETVMCWAGPRPILCKLQCDGPGRAEAHHIQNKWAGRAQPNRGPAHQHRPMTSLDNNLIFRKHPTFVTILSDLPPRRSSDPGPHSRLFSTLPATVRPLHLVDMVVGRYTCVLHDVEIPSLDTTLMWCRENVETYMRVVQ